MTLQRHRDRRVLALPAMLFPRREAAMRRRKFIALLGGAATWPAIGRAQQTVRSSASCFQGQYPAQRALAPYLMEFKLGLEAVGFIEGQKSNGRISLA